MKHNKPRINPFNGKPLKRFALIYDGTIVTDRLKTYDFTFNNNLLAVSKFLKEKEKEDFKVVNVDVNGECAVYEHSLGQFANLISRLDSLTL